MIKYNKNELIFSAIVENESEEICYDPETSQEICKKFGLKFTKMQIYEGIKNFEEFCEESFKIYEEISKGNIEEEGEGSILYLIHNQQENIVLNIWKIKTLEYKILIKLRKKIKTMIAKNETNDKSLKSFIKYVEEISEKWLKREKINELIEIGRKALQIIVKSNKKAEKTLFYNNYASFLELVKNENFKMNSGKFNDMLITMESPKSNNEMYDNDLSPILLEKKTKILSRIVIIGLFPFEFSVELENLILNSLKISYVERELEEKLNDEFSILNNNNSVVFLDQIPELKSENFVEKNIFFIIFKNNLINEKNLQFFVELLEEKMPENFDIISSERNKDLISSIIKGFERIEKMQLKGEISSKKICNKEIGNKIKSKKKQSFSHNINLIIFIPLGIPAMGKTTYIKIMQKVTERMVDCSFKVISSEQARKKYFLLFFFFKSIIYKKKIVLRKFFFLIIKLNK